MNKDNLDDLLNRTGPLLDDTRPILIPTDLLFKFNESQLQESALSRGLVSQSER